MSKEKYEKIILNSTHHIKVYIHFSNLFLTSFLPAMQSQQTEPLLNILP